MCPGIQTRASGIPQKPKRTRPLRRRKTAAAIPSEVVALGGPLVAQGAPRTANSFVRLSRGPTSNSRHSRRRSAESTQQLHKQIISSGALSFLAISSVMEPTCKVRFVLVSGNCFSRRPKIAALSAPLAAASRRSSAAQMQLTTNCRGRTLLSVSARGVHKLRAHQRKLKRSGITPTTA